MTKIKIILPLLALFVGGCTYKVIETPEECTEGLVVDIIDVRNSSCGVANGSITLEVLNSVDATGTEFQINNGPTQSEPQFENLSAGSYNIKVTNGVCETIVDVEVNNLDGLSAEAIVDESNCGLNDGSITIQSSNGVGSLQFKMEGKDPQNDPQFSGVGAGEYVITVSDESGCSVNLNVTVTNKSNYATIESIISGSCAVSGCHAGNVDPDFRVKENIINEASRIQSRTSAKTMPPVSSGSSLTDEQIDDIICWVESGAQG